MTSIIVMTVISDAPRDREREFDKMLPVLPGFHWRFVREGPLLIQVRTILQLDARAVAVWVGGGDGIHRAVKLISRLLNAGLPLVIAIAEVHDPQTESVLRQTGALYMCANEAQEHLGRVLEAILGPPSQPTDVKSLERLRT